MDKGKQTVLLVHNYYQIGGGEHTVFENEKNMLLENGHAVYIYTRSNDELKTSKWKLLLMPFSTVWSCKTYREVRRIIKEKKIDIIHCHNTFPLISPSVYYAARSLKVPVIQTIHNFRFVCPNGLFYCNGKICERCREENSFAPAIQNRCYRNSKIQTAVVAAMLTVHRWLGTYKKINYIFLTEFNKGKFSDLINTNGGNVFVKPNFVQLYTGEKPNCKQKTKFIYAARLDKYKGIDFLIDIWPTLPETYELHIYGDGKYRESCEEEATKHSNIRFRGFRPQSEILADLSDATAMLCLSDLYETFGMTMAESFSVGTPVVSADRGNLCEIVTASGGGVVFTCRSTDSFASALERIIENNEEYARLALNYFHANLTKESNYRKLCDIYERAKHIQ